MPKFPKARARIGVSARRFGDLCMVKPDLSQMESINQLVSFLRSYSNMQSQQLVAVQSSITELVDRVMSAVSNISNKTETKAKEADTVLVAVSTEPDAETAKLMGDLQNAADNVFAKASGSEIDAGTSGDSSSPDMENSLRRLGGRFTKHMEALSTLDNELKEVLFGVMGALSSDDVIRQRLEHVVKSTQILGDFFAQLSSASVMEDLNKAHELRMRALTSVYKSFTTEDEKEIFHSIFGKPVGKVKAS